MQNVNALKNLQWGEVRDSRYETPLDKIKADILKKLSYLGKLTEGEKEIFDLMIKGKL